MAAATNDLNKIIKDNTEQMRVFTDTIKYIVQNCKAVTKADMKHVGKIMDSFKEILNIMKEINILTSSFVINFNTQKVFKDISAVINLIGLISKFKFPNFLILKFNFWRLKVIFRMMYQTLNDIMKTSNDMQEVVNSFKAGIISKTILPFFNELKNIISLFDEFTIKFIIMAKFKFMILKSFIKLLFKSLSTISNTIMFQVVKLVKITTCVSLLKFVLEQFSQLLFLIRNFLSFRTMFWIWWRGKKYLKRLKRVIKYINKIADVLSNINFNIKGNVGLILINMIKLNLIILALQHFITIIRHMRLPFFFKFKVKKLISILNLLRKLIRKVISFVTSINNGLSGMKLGKSLKVLNKLKRLFKLLIDLVALIVFTTLIMALAMPVALLFLLFLWGLKMIINVTIQLLKSMRVVSPMIFLKLLLFMLLLTLLVVVGMAFVIFGLLLPIILKGILSFGLMILGMIVVLLLLALFGLVLTPLMPLIPIILIGLVLVMLLVISLLGVVLLLKLLEIIEFDPKKIVSNVLLILSIAKMVIASIFDSGVGDKEDEESKPWYKSVLEWIGGPFISIIGAILSIIFLALIFVSITLILLIATELRILQEINLQPNLIKQNVHIIIDTAKEVINALFEPQDEGEDNEPKNWFLSVLEWFAGTLVTIFKAILSIAILALAMVAITLVLFIATELRILQTIDLKPELIKQNVHIVIDTAQTVINSLFDPKDDKEDKPSNKGFFMTILEFFCKPLADILTAIMAIGFLALIVVAITLIRMIASQLSILQNLDLKPEEISKNVSTVIDTARLVIDSIFNRGDDSKPKEAKSIFRSILEMVLPNGLLDMIDAMMAIGFLALAKSAVGMVSEIAKNLTTIQNLPSMDGIQDKVGQIVDAAKQVVEQIINNGEGADPQIAEALAKTSTWIKDLISTVKLISDLGSSINNIEIIDAGKLNDIQNSLKMAADQQKQIINQIIKNGKGTDQKTVDALAKTSSWMKDMVSAVKMMNDLNSSINNIELVDSKKINDVQNSIKMAAGLLDSITTDAKSDIEQTKIRLDQLQLMQKIIKQFNNTTDKDIKNSETMLKNYSAFLDKIGSSNLEGLQTTTNLIREMAELSKSINGDFQGLADALNEKIAPLLEELKKSLEEIKEISQSSGGGEGAEGSAEGTAGTEPNATNNQVLPQKNDPQQNPQKQDQKLANSMKDVSSKLSELIDLFESGDARVRTT